MKLDDLIKDLTEKRANWGNVEVYVKERYIGGYDFKEPWATVCKVRRLTKNVVVIE